MVPSKLHVFCFVLFSLKYLFATNKYKFVHPTSGHEFNELFWLEKHLLAIRLSILEPCTSDWTQND